MVEKSSQRYFWPYLLFTPHAGSGDIVWDCHTSKFRRTVPSTRHGQRASFAPGPSVVLAVRGSVSPQRAARVRLVYAAAAGSDAFNLSTSITERLLSTHSPLQLSQNTFPQCDKNWFKSRFRSSVRFSCFRVAMCCAAGCVSRCVFSAPSR